MSVSKWNYEPSKCDGEYCCGDCDLCNKEPEENPHWIYNEKINMFECSKCGEVMVRNVYNFCPWCGIKMGGETE